MAEVYELAKNADSFGCAPRGGGGTPVLRGEALRLCQEIWNLADLPQEIE